ncbi:MAG: PKD domain-containing protein, partial [Candidatus Marinimicrobia bacterium]|nr:PKD domain-containing protein [Candidatus Neomarinimicrobiota bacterium]
VDTALITFIQTVYGPLSPVVPEFTSNLRAGKYPLTIAFHDESSGNTGWWQWDFGDGNYAISQNPIHTYHNPGVYPVRLTVHDSNGLALTVVKTNYIIVTTGDLSSLGDINNDNIINQLDIIICIQLIFQLIEPSPEQFLAADVNNDLKINLLDLLIIGDRLLGD